MTPGGYGLHEVGKQEEQESDLDTTDSFVYTLDLIGKEIIELFQGKINKLDISKGIKIALEILSIFVSVLTNKLFKKVEKIKYLLK